jgi:hypothetical protein
VFEISICNFCFVFISSLYFKLTSDSRDVPFKTNLSYRFGPGQLSFNASSTVAQYLVVEARLCVRSSEDKSKSQNVVVALVFERNLVGSMLNDFMPVVLAVVVGQLSNYFRHYKAAAAANLMLLLVLVTL